MAPIRLVALFTLISLTGVCQRADTVTNINKRRLHTMLAVSGVTYGASLLALNNLWYKNSPRENFHFFNDNAEWMQVDKLGHAFSSFYVSYGSSRALQWCGVAEKKSNAWGALTGFLLLVPIEVMDGYSSAYGASSGDLLADAGGAALFWGQTALWNEVRIYPKFSFHRTPYAPQRPNVLGDQFASELLKDYNGQTYWLSVDMDRFLRFPKWLNVAAGYGAQDMLYARVDANHLNGFNPYRQYYLSLDLDVTAIKTNSKAVRTLLYLVNMVKIPMPTLEFSNRGTTFHWLYF